MDLSENTRTGREHLRHHDGRNDDFEALETLYRDMQKEVSALGQRYALAFERIDHECDIDPSDMEDGVTEIYETVLSAKYRITVALDEEYGEEE